MVPEFTCVCPMTGQPDFATIRIRYVPDRWLVELKSLKLYMWAYRDEGAFHEDVTNRILADLVRRSPPSDGGRRRLERAGRDQDGRDGALRGPAQAGRSSRGRRHLGTRAADASTRAPRRQAP